MKYQKIKGTFDVLPEETSLWQYIENAIREEAQLYGFEEIRFPTFEQTELFTRGVGGTTDIVKKEMYTFDDKDGTSLTLRPEGTACVARSVIENGLYARAMPLKLYYLANFFRHEKPQAGRSREFVQFGTEIYGTSSPLADATAISMANGVFRRLGVKGVKLYINSIGCPECRKNFHAALKEYFSGVSAELCDTCRERLNLNPLRILDCKSEICGKLADGAPKTVDYLCDECSDHFESLKSLLDGMGIEYTVNPRIVRGLDYYTKTVFEFVAEGIGAQSTVCGGGRYDGLIEQIGGQPLAGVGFGMGITRLITAMEQSGAIPDTRKVPLIYIAPLGAEAAKMAAVLTEQLRAKGVHAETDLCSRSLKAQMKYADKCGARYTVVLGENEIAQNECVLKNMAGGSTPIRVDEIINIAEGLNK